MPAPSCARARQHFAASSAHRAAWSPSCSLQPNDIVQPNVLRECCPTCSLALRAPTRACCATSCPTPACKCCVVGSHATPHAQTSPKARKAALVPMVECHQVAHRWHKRHAPATREEALESVRGVRERALPAPFREQVQCSDAMLWATRQICDLPERGLRRRPDRGGRREDQLGNASP